MQVYNLFLKCSISKECAFYCIVQQRLLECVEKDLIISHGICVER